ncbi:MAG: RNA 2',3'-cyclic phosphodiesterase, partial [Nanoarchaeota archaeon]
LFHDFDNLKKRRLFLGKNTQKNSLHLTMRFLGDLTEEEIKKTEIALRKIKFPKFSCSLGKAGFFGDTRRIDVIWIELLSDKLILLEKEISNAVNENYGKEFTPHITLSRMKKVFNKKKLAEAIKNFNFKSPGFEVKEFLLMKSELTSDGPKYKIIEKFPLN